ncbi:MAG: hypothetical protein NT056_06330, partial [Proteobacteria bacterium]|nr:hypothetical protein [Pseudomonadota bacterium]
KEYRMNQEIELPESFRGRPIPRPKSTRVVERTGRVLTGIPVSPGKVTGKARVILSPRAEAKILPGEILVAPVTDAGWTPLFLVARGLVVDVGQRQGRHPDHPRRGDDHRRRGPGGSYSFRLI